MKNVLHKSRFWLPELLPTNQFRLASLSLSLSISLSLFLTGTSIFRPRRMKLRTNEVFGPVTNRRGVENEFIAENSGQKSIGKELSTIELRRSIRISGETVRSLT